MSEGAGDPFPAFFAALEERHRRDLTFAEVRRALQALSSLYVQRRGRLAAGAALEGAGKRAAFALYYGALHFLLVRGVVRALGAATPPPGRVLDLGCGTGVAGAAWAVEAGGGAFVEGVDRSAWAAEEARWTLRALRLRGAVRRGEVARAEVPARADALVAAFTVNELADEARASLKEKLLAAAAAGTRVLVLEPLARGVAPWWEDWRAAFAATGGREDEWRLPAERPPTLVLLDKASGLDHRLLTARSLYAGASARTPPRASR